MPLNLRERAPRFLQLQLGLFCFAVGISLMLEAGIGLDPWSAFHQGVVLHSPLSFGQVSQSTGVVLILVAVFVLRERPGLGTLFNMAVIGPWIDLLRAQAWFPTADGLPLGIAEFVAGVAVCGLACGLYIGARFGAGPRDAFVLGLSRRTGRSIRAVRVTIEVIVLATGWGLGASIGIGTVLFAVLMGPMMQISLKLFGFEHRH